MISMARYRKRLSGRGGCKAMPMSAGRMLRGW